MTLRHRAASLCALAATVLATGAATTLVVPAAHATAPSHASVGGVKLASSSARTSTGYRPPQGATFNNPLGTGPQQYAVLNVIQNAIKHAKNGSTIKVMSWNIMSRTAVDALLAAQERGVKIRVLMDDSNLTDVPNPYFKRLRHGFNTNNQSIKPDRRSYAKTCLHSCRGKGGQAHAKYYLFSHTGSAHEVLMEGSENLTAASATNQWNDIFTFIGNDKLYTFAGKVFAQAWKDTPVAEPYVHQATASGTLYFSPFRGTNFKANPVLSLLNKVHCLGAVNGNKGRTIVRVAPDVMRNDRGMRAAERIRALWTQGCDVELVYTVMGRDIHDYLTQTTKRGKLPMRHLVQDVNGDGEFDNYFHLKAISIDGVVGDNPAAHWMVNGSANMSGNSSASDENIMISQKKYQVLKYQKFITYWFNHPPKSKSTTSTTSGRRMTSVPVNPYAHVDMD